MKIGETAKTGRHKKLYDECWAGYIQFIVAVESALFTEAMENPHKSENKRILKWLLESKLPEEYGKKKEVTVKGNRESRPTKLEVVYLGRDESAG